VISSGTGTTLFCEFSILPGVTVKKRMATMTRATNARARPVRIHFFIADISYALPGGDQRACGYRVGGLRLRVMPKTASRDTAISPFPTLAQTGATS
jgi:hypothetical protein